MILPGRRLESQSRTWSPMDLSLFSIVLTSSLTNVVARCVVSSVGCGVGYWDVAAPSLTVSRRSVHRCSWCGGDGGVWWWWWWWSLHISYSCAVILLTSPPAGDTRTGRNNQYFSLNPSLWLEPTSDPDDLQDWDQIIFWIGWCKSVRDWVWVITKLTNLHK